jgi:hypothetical protein
MKHRKVKDDEKGFNASLFEFLSIISHIRHWVLINATIHINGPQVQRPQLNPRDPERETAFLKGVFRSTPCGSFYNDWTGCKDLFDVPLKPLEIRRLEAILIPNVEMGNGSACMVGTNDFLGDIHLPRKFFFLFFSRIRGYADHEFVHLSFILLLRLASYGFIGCFLLEDLAL